MLTVFWVPSIWLPSKDGTCLIGLGDAETHVVLPWMGLMSYHFLLIPSPVLMGRRVSKYLSIWWWTIGGHWFHPPSPRTLISYRRDGYLPSLFLMEECASQVWWHIFRQYLLLAVSFVLSRQKMVQSWAPATYFPPRDVTQVFLACPLVGGTQDDWSAVGSPQWAQGHMDGDWLWDFTHLNPVKSLRFE